MVERGTHVFLTRNIQQSCCFYHEGDEFWIVRSYPRKDGKHLYELSPCDGFPYYTSARSICCTEEDFTLDRPY